MMTREQRVYFQMMLGFSFPLSFVLANALGDRALGGWFLGFLPWGLLFLLVHFRRE
jgi:hypothetical protein